MKIAKSHAGIFAVFPSEASAERWDWLYRRILRRKWACYGGYFNAFQLLGE